jgi:hypothetical protein
MKKCHILILAVVLPILALAYLYNLKSQLHFLLRSDNPLIAYDASHQVQLYESEAIKISRLELSREGDGIGRGLVNMFSQPVLYLFEMKRNKANFRVSYHPQGSTAPRNLEAGALFSINSAFYTEDFKPTGLIVVDGKRYGQPSSSSGHFKVVGGVAKAGPTSIFTNDAAVEYSCQSHPSLMKDGYIWDYIQQESLNPRFWNIKTYRSLVGHKANGNVCFLVSGNGGLLSIKEIAEVAKASGIVTATCLDAGSALQYAFDDGEFSLSFSTINNRISLGDEFDKWLHQRTNKRFYSESPTFIEYGKY